jgi:DNA-binding XRE family transcriptional regulator
MPEQLNRRLQEAFNERSLNPSSLAQRAGVSRSTIHQWLRRPDLAVDALTLRKVAEYLGWSVEDAFRWAELLPPRLDVDPLGAARQSIANLPVSQAGRSALVKLAEELSRVADDDCRIRFAAAWGKVTEEYAAWRKIPRDAWLVRIEQELRLHMFGE